MKDKINAKIAELEAILKAADDENDGELTEEQETQIKTLKDDIKKLQAQQEATKSARALIDAAQAPEPAASIEPAQADAAAPAPAPALGITATPAAEADARFGWDHAGDFFAAVMDAANPAINTYDERLNLSAQAGLNQGVGSEGGFLVPTEFGTQIWDAMRDNVENLVERTRQFTVTGEAVELPVVDETSRATGSRFGGVQGFFINEADTITRSNPTFRRLRLEPHELAVLIPVTNKLMRNAPMALGEFLTRAASDELVFLASNAIINGTGAGQPLGILNSGARVTAAAEGGQAADTIVFENINNMWLRMWAPARRNAVWLINQDIEAQLAEMSLSVGTGGLPVYLPANGVSGQPFDTLKGRPIIPIEYAQTLGDEGDIILADLMGGYTTGIRRDIEAATSIHVLFESAQSLFRFMWAVDGSPWMTTALTPFNGASTLSHFVTLAART